MIERIKKYVKETWHMHIGFATGSLISYILIPDCHPTSPIGGFLCVVWGYT